MKASDTYLITWGGCGTKLQWARFGRENMNQGVVNFNPHQRFPWVKNKRARVLYQIGHPLDAILSLTNAESKIFTRRDAWEMHQGNVNLLRNVNDLYEYANTRSNAFDFTGHLLGWVNYCRHHDIEIRFLRYEDIPHRQHEVANYFGLQPRGPVQWRPRASNWRKDILRSDLLRPLIDTHKHDIATYESIKTTV